MNLTRSALIQQIQICQSLKSSTETRVRSLQEQESHIQNELFVARKLDNLLDFLVEICQNEISRMDLETQDKQ